MEIGDSILHPRYGVGKIKSIEKRMDDGVARDYYVIPKPSISSTVFVPVDTADELGLRPLSTAETLEEAVSILSGNDDTSLHVHGRSIKWNDPLDLARLIRICIVRPFPKAAPPNQVKHAKVLLAEELTAVLGMSEQSIFALVEKKGK